MAREEESTEQSQFHFARPCIYRGFGTEQAVSYSLVPCIEPPHLLPHKIRTLQQMKYFLNLPKYSPCPSASLAFICLHPTLPAQHFHTSRALHFPFLPSPILHLGGGSLASMVALASFSTAGLCRMSPGSLGSLMAIKLTLFFR